MTTIFAAMDDRLVVVDGDEPRVVRPGTSRLECVAASGSERLLVGTLEDGLLGSTDGGETWTRLGAETVASDAVTALATNPQDTTEVWAGTEPSAVYRSTDAGETWEPTPADLTALPSSDEWAFPPRPHTHHVRWLAVDPRDPEHLFVAVEAGALVTTRDRGETWRDRPPGSRRDTHSLAIHPDRPAAVYCASGDGFARSPNGGENWTAPQTGLDHRYCWSVAVDPGDPDTVLLSAASGAYAAHTASRADTHVYRRDDWDETGSWERLDDRGLPTGEGVTRPVFVAGDDPGELYAVSNRGLYRTDDAGDSWRAVTAAWPESVAETACRGVAVVR